MISWRHEPLGQASAGVADREGRMAKREGAEGIRPYDKPAGGWGSLWATARAVRAQMDLDEASRTLMRANKPDGFDCPGCAWPDKERLNSR